ncbi:MAG: isochorismatase family protein [Methylacidiphilales bacterium]|nr:isochorismatase family protein [Candidatus Methylacidiphilales bacterium]
MDLEKKSLPFGNHPALLVIDVMKGFTDTNCSLGSPADQVVANCQELLSLFRVKQLPICFTRVIYTNDHEASVFRSKVPALAELKQGSPWNEIDHRLVVEKEDFILIKKWASAFFATHLPQWLIANQVDCIILTGLSTSGCVRATAVDGLQHNYPVFVVSDACGDRNTEAHLANLHDMQAKYGEVVTVAKIKQLLQ